MGAGIAAADFDDDGDIDVFVPNGDGVPDQLYRNLGNGQFEEVAAAAGLASTDKNRCALWLDYDGDQDLDLFVANDDPNNPTAYRLFRQNAAGLFEDVTVGAGLFVPMGPAGPTFSGRHRGGISAGDLNNDGYLDIFAPMWSAQANLFMNNGDGTFTDATVSSGIGTEPRLGHQSMMFDFDADGWLDLYQCIDGNPNLLWINQHDGTFIETAAAAGMDSAFTDMGMSLGDYDNDGKLDVYITNVFWTVKPPVPGHNVLLHNNSVLGTLSFADVSEALGVDQGGWGWGTTFIDANGDGRLDIAATNGWAAGGYASDPSKFFLNLGGDPVSFVDQSVDMNFADTFWGSSLIAFDSDRDGDLDLMQTCMNGPLRLLENRIVLVAGTDNFLTVKPRMPGGTNYRAIGATVRIVTGSLAQMRLITAGTSYMGQEPAEAFFGLGNANVVDSVTVDWPNGDVTRLYDVPANQVMTFAYDPGLPGCGDGTCTANETPCNCSQDCGLPTATEVQGSTCSDGIDNDCDGRADCDDSDCCDDGNSCTFDHCVNGVCGFTPAIYGDVNHDGTVGLFDLFCVLDGFSGIFSSCTLVDSDVEPCGGNSVLNLFDLFAVLDAFSGVDPCCGTP